MKHWLAWCPDDGDRDDARTYTTQNDHVYDSDDVATAFAERLYGDSAGEIGCQFDVYVVEVLDSGTERHDRFEISVELEPVFSAHPRETP